MDEAAKQEHADLLRKAIEESDLSRETIADLMGRTYRTVGYWTSRTKPTMPSGEERAMLRRHLGPYDSPGDAVERAIRQSELVEWRQSRLISVYQEYLADQRREQAG